MKKLLILSLVLVSFLTSCEQSAQLNEMPLSINRSAFIKGHDRDVQKSAFFTLRFEQQRDLWLDKLAQVHRNNYLPKDFRSSLAEIYSVIKNAKDADDIVTNPKLANHAIKMAGMTSRQAYAQMFSSLEDYQMDQNDFKNIDKSFAEEVKKDFENVFRKISQARTETDSDSTVVGGEEEYQRACNCRWTCRATATYDCEPTKDGCGFLNFMSCSKRD